MAATMNPMEVITQPIGYLRNPNYVEAAFLAANSAQSIPVPTSAAYVTFAANVDFYVAYVSPATVSAGSAQSATVPSVTTSGGVACELNPLTRYIKGVTSLSVISASNGILTLGFYTA